MQLEVGDGSKSLTIGFFKIRFIPKNKQMMLKRLFYSKKQTNDA
jgi:hypothetical protein